MSTFENFVAMVGEWTAEERGQVFTLLGGGSAVAAAVVSTPVKTVAAKAAKSVAPKAPVKKAMPSKPLPEGVPTAADYRLSEADIDLSVCLGRVFAAEPDKRFRPAVYQEGQCGAAPVEGGDLCATCQRRMTKYAEAGVEKPGPWLGRVSEDPMPWSNMLDSAKMLAKPPKWVADGGSDAGSAAASEGGAESEGAEQMPLSSSSSSAPVVAVGGAGAPPKPVKLSAAEKAAALAEKAKVAAEKAAAAVAKKEAAEAKKAAATAKKAEKAAAPKPAPKPAAAKAAKAAAPAASVVVSNSAASSAEPVEAEGEFDMLDGELRFVRNGNVYEFDAMTEKVGAFLGRKTADGTIDTDADEVGAAEAE
jgi:hypothetical protein